MVRACVLYTQCPWFESKYPHQSKIPFGIYFYTQKYLNKNGAVRQRPIVTDVVTVSDIRNGNFKVKELKRLAASAESPVSVPPASGGFAPVEDDEDLPF